MSIVRFVQGRYAQLGVACALAMVSVCSMAQEAGGDIDTTAATEMLTGLVGKIAGIGGLLLGAVAAITAWKYIRAGAAS